MKYYSYNGDTYCEPHEIAFEHYVSLSYGCARQRFADTIAVDEHGVVRFCSVKLWKDSSSELAYEWREWTKWDTIDVSYGEVPCNLDSYCKESFSPRMWRMLKRQSLRNLRRKYNISQETTGLMHGYHYKEG